MFFAMGLCIVLYGNGTIDGLQALMLLGVSIGSFVLRVYENQANSKIIDSILEHQCIITSILGRIRNGE